MSYFDLTNRYAGLDAKNAPLLTLDKVVPWNCLAHTRHKAQIVGRASLNYRYIIESIIKPDDHK